MTKKIPMSQHKIEGLLYFIEQLLKTCKYFDKLDEIYSERVNTHPPYRKESADIESDSDSGEDLGLTTQDLPDGGVSISRLESRLYMIFQHNKYGHYCPKKI